MTKTKIKLLTRQISYGFIAVVTLLSYFPSVASAAPITARSVSIGSSAANASTTYAFTFTVPTTGTAIKSVGFRACTTASGDCATPIAGFSSASSTLTSQPSNLDGAGVNSGWTVSTATAGELRLSKAGATVTPQPAITVGFSNVTNPSVANETFYMRITTYSDASWTLGNAIDTGIIATSTAGQVTVSVAIDESLTFTLASTTVSLTQPTTASTGTGTSSMTVSTNAASGYSVSYGGTTLTSGAKTIDAMAAQAASAANTKQFGLNLRLNTTATSNPAVGADNTGTGTGTPATGYETPDQFKFNTAGDIVATASLPTNTNTFTTSYIVNMDGSTAAGVYSTILTYTAIANF